METEIDFWIWHEKRIKQRDRFFEYFQKQKKEENDDDRKKRKGEGEKKGR